VAVQGSAFIFSLIFLGRWAAHLGSLRTVLGGTLTAALAMVVLASARTIAGLWVGGALLGLGLGLLQIHTLSQFAVWGAKLGRGRVSGLSALVGPTGGFLGGLLGGVAGASVSLQSMFLFFVPLLAWLAWNSWRAHPKPQMFSA
jgi:MFS family permease